MVPEEVMVGAGAEGSGKGARGVGGGDDCGFLLVEDDGEDGLDHVGILGLALGEELVVVAGYEVRVDVALREEGSRLRNLFLLPHFAYVLFSHAYM